MVAQAFLPVIRAAGHSCPSSFSDEQTGMSVPPQARMPVPPVHFSCGCAIERVVHGRFADPSLDHASRTSPRHAFTFRRSRRAPGYSAHRCRRRPGSDRQGNSEPRPSQPAGAGAGVTAGAAIEAGAGARRDVATSLWRMVLHVTAAPTSAAATSTGTANGHVRSRGGAA